MTAATEEMEVETSKPADEEEVNEITNNDTSSSPTSAVTNVYATNKDNSRTKVGDADDDDDDAIMAEDETTTPTATKATSSSSTAVVFSPELLKMYYSRLFPFELLHSWLAYDPTATSSPNNKTKTVTKRPNNNNKYGWIFSRREFSMTIEPTPEQEIYIRYQSFSDEQELTQAILKRRPTKIDLGAIFSHPPKDHKTLQKGKLQPVQRELVFDIDLTDYDDVRCCGCTGAKICSKCWTFMTMAVEVMEVGLRRDFGFQHIAWFYSGRRGVHAWICDETARTLPNEARNAVASYFEVQLANENNKDIELPLPLHPSLRRAYEILEPWFISHILPASGHGLLASSKRWKKDLLDTIPEAGKTVATLLERKWDSTASTPAQKWEQLKRHIMVLIGKSSGGDGNNTKAAKSAKTMDVRTKERLEHWPIEVVFRHTYPRLDINVSKTMNHLLKSPFCVHPKTGRVCVPFEASQVRDFDPFVVPTLDQLMRELDNYHNEQQQQQQQQAKDDDDNNMEDNKEDNKETGSKQQQQRNIKHDWQKTSLQEYFQPFQRNFLEPLQKEIRSKEKQLAEEEAAIRGDF